MKCPKCGSSEWLAAEQFSALTPCTIELVDGQVEIIFDLRSEMARQAATSVVTMYICANEECGHTVEPLGLNELGGQA